MTRTRETTFRKAWRKLVPSWLQVEDGERILYSIGLLMDAHVERLYQGLLARFPEYEPPADAFAAMSRDRLIFRGLNESDADFAVRLIPWLDVAKRRGTAFELLQQVWDYLGGVAMVRSVDERGNWFTIAADGTRSYLLDQGNWNWDDSPVPTKRGRFWVIIYPPATLWTEGPKWGDSDLWGGTWGDKADKTTWGSTATSDAVQSIRGIVRTYKPGGTRCEKIIIAFDPASFDPASSLGDPGMPDGTWGRPCAPVGGTYVATRLSTARYWRGS